MEDINQDEKPPDDHVLLEVEGKIQLLSTSDIQVDVDTTETIKMASPVIDSSPSKSKGFEVLQKPSGHLDQNKPFHDAYTSRYLVLPRKGSFNKERESCNNQAYQSWLKHKIEQELYHKRRESLNAADTMKDRSEERKQMNERAFRAWLEKKNVQIVKERQSSSAIQATMCPDLKTKSYSFEQWLKKKEEQKLEQIKLEQRRRKEEEELSKQVDPDMAGKAYKRWLLQKKNQALDAAAAKEKYRKLFLRETRQLTITLRFQGF